MTMHYAFGHPYNNASFSVCDLWFGAFLDLVAIGGASAIDGSYRLIATISIGIMGTRKTAIKITGLESKQQQQQQLLHKY